MQNVELWALLAVAVVAIVATGTRLLADRRIPRSASMMTLGVGAGTVGAIAVLVLRLDLVPDAYEGAVMAGIAVAITLALLTVSWRRLQDG